MTNSLSFPNMFDVARNKVSVIEDGPSVVNRVRLLILTEPTELYNSPKFGVGLKRHLWHYNSENEKAIIKERIVEQLRLYEPSCYPDKTSFADGLLFSDTEDGLSVSDQNKLKMTVGIQTIFGYTAEINLNAQDIFGNNTEGILYD